MAYTKHAHVENLPADGDTVNGVLKLLIPAAVLILSAPLVAISHLYILPDLGSNQFWAAALTSDFFLVFMAAAFSRNVLQPQYIRARHGFYRLTILLISLLLCWLVNAPLILMFYPPVAVVLSNSIELKTFYAACSKIEQGQSIDSVQSTMSPFHLSSKTAYLLNYNTPALSADFCEVKFNEEANPSVKMVIFVLD